MIGAVEGSESDAARIGLLARIKALAAVAVGFEKAVGRMQVGGLANLFAGRLYKRLGLEGLGLQEAFEKLNNETVFRMDTYTGWGGLVRDESGEKAFYLIGRECPVRQILYQEELPAGCALCRLMMRFLERVFREKLGGMYRVCLRRYGPNACLLRVGIVRGQEPPASFSLESREPSLDEYIEKLRIMYDEMLHALSDALYMVLGGNAAMSYRMGKAYGAIDGRHILANFGSTMSLEEAISVVNESLRVLVRLVKEDDGLRLERSIFHDIVEGLGIRHPEAVYYAVQGYIAGILSTLTGRNIDLRLVDLASRRYKIYVR